MHAAPARSSRRLVALAAALLLVGTALLAGATYTGADAATPRPVASSSLTCSIRWLLHVFFNVGTPCSVPTTTTTALPTTSTTSEPPPTTTTTVATGPTISGVTSLVDCGFRYRVPCGWGTPAGATVRAVRGDAVVTTRSDALGRYSLTLPSGDGDARIELVLDEMSPAPFRVECVGFTYTPSMGDTVSNVHIACGYARLLGTIVPCYEYPTTPMVPPSPPVYSGSGPSTTTTTVPVTVTSVAVSTHTAAPTSTVAPGAPTTVAPVTTTTGCPR